MMSGILDNIMTFILFWGGMTVPAFAAAEPSPERDDALWIGAIADKDFEKGFLSVLEYTYMKLTAAGGAIYPLTEEAVKYYLPDIAGWV